MELSFDEKCAIKRGHVVKIVKEAGKALSFEDVSKMYFKKFKWPQRMERKIYEL